MKLFVSVLSILFCLAASVRSQGLVSVPDGGLIDIALIYSLPDGKKNQARNPSGKRLYENNAQIARLHPEAARRLKLAVNRMGLIYSFAYSLRVYDAYRERGAQNALASLNGMAEYARASNAHTQGKAVDVGLANSEGWALDMGTLVNDMGDCSFSAYEGKCRKEGKLNPTQLRNRQILRDIMLGEAGWCQPEGTGWWHFELCD